MKTKSLTKGAYMSIKETLKKALIIFGEGNQTIMNHELKEKKQIKVNKK